MRWWFVLTTCCLLGSHGLANTRHPALWVHYESHPSLPQISASVLSLGYDPRINLTFAMVGTQLWSGEPFTTNQTLTNNSHVFVPTSISGNFSRIVFQNDTLFLLGDVLWWLAPNPNANNSLDWFSRDVATPWPAGYVFTGIAYGSGNGTANGTWVCLRANASDLSKTTLTAGFSKPTCTDVNTTINYLGAMPEIRDVIYAANLFVAVGRNVTNGLPSILTSSDGVNWNPVNISDADTQAKGVSQTLTSIRYGGGQFVAVGFETCCLGGAVNVSQPPPLIVTSLDGVIWQRHLFVEPFYYAALTDLVFNGESWVAIGEATIIGDKDGWTPIYWHLNVTGAPMSPPVPPLQNLLYLDALQLYYASSGSAVYVATTLAGGHECDATYDCKGHVLLPPYQDVRVCSPVSHKCVECVFDSDCPSAIPRCNASECTDHTVASSASRILMGCWIFSLSLLFF